MSGMAHDAPPGYLQARRCTRPGKNSCHARRLWALVSECAAAIGASQLLACATGERRLRQVY